MQKKDYCVVVITSDGDELEDEMITAHSPRDAAGIAFANMGCDGVETIFASNEDDPTDRGSYQQVGHTLRQE